MNSDNNKEHDYIMEKEADGTKVTLDSVFRNIRENDEYFVDKSMLIDDILGSRGKVFLFTRPRRFGKTIALTMLDAYLNMRYAGNRWFDGLAVSEARPDDPMRNSLPVVYFDFSPFAVKDYRFLLMSMAGAVSRAYYPHRELLDSPALSEEERDFVSRGRMGRLSETELMQSASALVRFLAAHHGRKVAVLIDEYDLPFTNGFMGGYYDETAPFLRGFLTPLFKNNPDVALGVMVGCAQIAKESLFSGLNNIVVNNILSEQSDERFGFTPEEVRRICEDAGDASRYDEAAEWYDGYIFGRAEVFNPFSVISYVDGFKPECYWVNTGTNPLIRILLGRLSGQVMRDLMKLAGGDEIHRDMTTHLTFPDSGRPEDMDEDTIYSTMAQAGYVKVRRDGEGYSFSIPNREVFQSFSDDILRWVETEYGSPSGARSLLSRAVEDADPERISLLLSRSFRHSGNFRLFDHEHVYQAWVAGMLMDLNGRYRLLTEPKAGDGYADIMLVPTGSAGKPVIIEIKRRESGSLVAAADEAIAQIHDREYYRVLRGRVRLYGIAVSAGEAFTRVEEIDVR